jgi:hypothetical protein
MPTVLRILDETIELECASRDRRRFKDLAAALEARLSSFCDEGSPDRRLVLAAIALLDETQAMGAALARAYWEIERLNDLVAEARAEGLLGDRRMVNALRA